MHVSPRGETAPLRAKQAGKAHKRAMPIARLTGNGRAHTELTNVQSG
jgi:hypothetical protein